MLDYTRRIPDIKFPSIEDYDYNVLNEEVLPISGVGIQVDSQYYQQGIEGSYKECYARETVINMLLKAQSLLPRGLKLKVYDAYRPIVVQTNLWNMYRQKVQDDNPNLNDEELDFKTSFFVSKPSVDIYKPSLHNTGGAVDVTICTFDGYALNMGTLFDDFTNRAWTNHFESYESNIEVRNNRRLLYNVMIEAGFTNLPSEWWHYDYGDKFWAYFTGNKAKYLGYLM
jgi:D-alanyl-D-alanine dipeptidase